VLGSAWEILMTFSDHPRELLTKHFNTQVEVMPGGQGKQIATISESTQKQILQAY
jgi:glycerol-3-phosphate responsive antiterminator